MVIGEFVNDDVLLLIFYVASALLVCEIDKMKGD